MCIRDRYVDVIPAFSDDVVRLEWYQEGALISTEDALLDYRPFSSQDVRVDAYTEHGCLTTRSITIEVDTQVDVYTPNVFMKDVPGLDRFVVGTDPSVEDIRDLIIYDRWGGVVHRYSGPVAGYTGWDGYVSSGYAEQGVYTYIIDFVSVDGLSELRAGTVTFIR